MIYNANSYTKTETVKTDSYNGQLNISSNGYVNFVIAGVKRAIQWYAWKFIFLGVFIVVIGWVGKGKVDAYKTADEMADHAASDGWFKAFDQFKKKTKFQSTKANSHPLYNSTIIKEWEEETKLKFSKIYQYIQIKDSEGKREALFVMKKPAFDIEDPEKKTLVLDFSTVFVDDAEDVCDRYFGEVPTDYQKSFYDRKRHWNIRKIKNEVTQENDGEGKFRCVVNHETVQDLLED